MSMWPSSDQVQRRSGICIINQMRRFSGARATLQLLK